MVVRQDLFGVVPAREDSFSVRVVGEERDEATGAAAGGRQDEPRDAAHLGLGLGLDAAVLVAARARTRVGCRAHTARTFSFSIS